MLIKDQGPEPGSEVGKHEYPVIMNNNLRYNNNNE